ncbi:uncharacterized protein [Procambarus clarkii]|uniref:uncharacterized protein n=1 Tax=Procambarus clarkii TaxID=6728 RepID=UPI003742CBD7
MSFTEGVTLLSYADDLALVITGPSLLHKAQGALDQVASECSVLGLKISAQKSKAMRLGDYRHTANNIKISGKVGNNIKLSGKAGNNIKLSGKAGNNIKLSGKVGNNINLSGKAGNNINLSGKAGNNINLSGKAGKAGNNIKLCRKTGNNFKLSWKAGNNIKLCDKAGNDRKLFKKDGNNSKLSGKAGNNCKLSGWTAVQLAAFRGHNDVVKILTRVGADVNKENEVYIIDVLQFDASTFGENGGGMAMGNSNAEGVIIEVLETADLFLGHAHVLCKCVYCVNTFYGRGGRRRKKKVDKKEGGKKEEDKGEEEVEGGGQGGRNQEKDEVEKGERGGRKEKNKDEGGGLGGRRRRVDDGRTLLISITLRPGEIIGAEFAPLRLWS